MKKKKLSGPQIFMYSMILLTAAISSVFFTLHYGGILSGAVYLWCGIVSFMVLYHFGLRILLGEIMKRFPPDKSHGFYRQKCFEPSLYRFLRVRRWKDKVLTFDTAAYDFGARTPTELAVTMCKSERDHWINELISIAAVFFFILWGYFPIFLISSVFTMIFDAQFIIVQRYNRPIVLRYIDRLERRKTKIKSV